jgi:hypothetical protein
MMMVRDLRRLIVATMLVIGCTQPAGSVVLGWGSDEPAGTTYEVIVDGRLFARVVTSGREVAVIEDGEERRRKSNAPLQVNLASGARDRIIRNRKPYWSKIVSVEGDETEFCFSLPDPEGESPDPTDPAG